MNFGNFVVYAMLNQVPLITLRANNNHLKSIKRRLNAPTLQHIRMKERRKYYNESN